MSRPTNELLDHVEDARDWSDLQLPEGQPHPQLPILPPKIIGGGHA